MQIDLLREWVGRVIREDQEQRRKDGMVSTDFDPPLTQSGEQLLQNEESWEGKFREALRLAKGDMEAATKWMPKGKDGEQLHVRTLRRQAYKAMGRDAVLKMIMQIRADSREESEREEERKGDE